MASVGICMSACEQEAHLGHFLGVCSQRTFTCPADVSVPGKCLYSAPLDLLGSRGHFPFFSVSYRTAHHKEARLSQWRALQTKTLSSHPVQHMTHPGPNLGFLLHPGNVQEHLRDLAVKHSHTVPVQKYRTVLVWVNLQPRGDMSVMVGKWNPCRDTRSPSPAPRQRWGHGCRVLCTCQAQARSAGPLPRRFSSCSASALRGSSPKREERKERCRKREDRNPKRQQRNQKKTISKGPESSSTVPRTFTDGRSLINTWPVLAGCHTDAWPQSTPLSDPVRGPGRLAQPQAQAFWALVTS